MVGYTGGAQVNPTYRAIKDHTEALLVEFDASATSFETLLDLFWAEHDPSEREDELERQYRHAIWYFNDEQKALIDASVAALTKKGVTVNTAVEPAVTFYRAEESHQKFLDKESARA